MNLHINGAEIGVSKEIDSISDLLTWLQLGQKIVIVELNKHIVDKLDHAKTKVADGDRIELVHFVGGG